MKLNESLERIDEAFGFWDISAIVAAMVIMYKIAKPFITKKFLGWLNKKLEKEGLPPLKSTDELYKVIGCNKELTAEKAQLMLKIQDTELAKKIQSVTPLEEPSYKAIVLALIKDPSDENFDKLNKWAKAFTN